MVRFVIGGALFAWAQAGVCAQALACQDPVPAPAYAVAVSGDDADDGSPAHPFRTLERARQAMRAGEVRTTYVDGGVYALSAPLRLDRDDERSAFLACPEQTPALDGGAAGLSSLVEIENGAGIALHGLTFAHASGAAVMARDSTGLSIERNLFQENGIGVLLIAGVRNGVCGNRILRSAHSGVEIKDGSDLALVAHNTIDGVDAPATHGGGVFVHGATDTAIVRNAIQNTRGAGIAVANWDDGTINRGTLVSGNVVRATNRKAEDSGAIYLLGRSHVDQRSRIADNLIDDAGAAGDAHSIAVYLDDSTSGVVVEGNLMRRPGTHAVQIHGGDDVSIRSNFFDLGDKATSAVLFQAAPEDTKPTNTMRGNRVSRNIVVAHGAARPAYSFIDGGTPEIAGNLQVRPAGWAAAQDGLASDVVLALPAGVDLGDDATIMTLAGGLIDFKPIDLSAAGPDRSAGCAITRDGLTLPRQ